MDTINFYKSDTDINNLVFTELGIETEIIKKHSIYNLDKFKEALSFAMIEGYIDILSYNPDTNVFYIDGYNKLDNRWVNIKIHITSNIKENGVKVLEPYFLGKQVNEIILLKDKVNFNKLNNNLYEIELLKGSLKAAIKKSYFYYSDFNDNKKILNICSYTVLDKFDTLMIIQIYFDYKHPKSKIFISNDLSPICKNFVDEL